MYSNYKISTVNKLTIMYINKSNIIKASHHFNQEL